MLSPILRYLKKHALLNIILISITMLASANIYFLNIIGTENNSDNKSSDVVLASNRQLLKGFQEQRRQYTQLIEKKGAEEAYKEFKDFTIKLPLKNQHDQAHLFGEALYSKVGIQGTVICDETFSYGCYHSFFAKAISDQGIEIVSELNEACDKKFGSSSPNCTHGLGHGILYSLGKDKLSEALDICYQYSWKHSIGGCASGVFMEYNLKTMDNPNVEPEYVRKYDNQNPHFPCNVVQNQFKEACYYEMPHWWSMLLGRPGESYEQIGKLCNEAPSDTEKKACYKGAGNIAAPLSQYHLESTKNLCKKMLTEEGQRLCLIQASWSFVGAQQPKAYTICSSLPSHLQALCAPRSPDDL